MAAIANQTLTKLSISRSAMVLKPSISIDSPLMQIKNNLKKDTTDDFLFGAQLQSSRLYPSMTIMKDPVTSANTTSWRVVDYQALKDMGISSTWEKYRIMDSTETDYYRTQSLSAATNASIKIFIDGYDDLTLVKHSNSNETINPLTYSAYATKLKSNLKNFTETFDCFGGVQLVDEPCLDMEDNSREKYKDIYDEYRALVIANKLNIKELGGEIYCNAFPAYATFQQLKTGNSTWSADQMCTSEDSDNETYVEYLKAIVNPGKYLATIDPTGSKYNGGVKYDETLTTDAICSNNFVTTSDEAILSVQKPFFRAMWKVKETFPEKPLWNHVLCWENGNYKCITADEMKYQIYLNMACGMQRLLFFGLADKISSAKTSDGSVSYYYIGQNAPFDAFHKTTETYDMMKELLTGECHNIGSLVKNADFIEHEFYSSSSEILPSFIESITSGEIVASKIKKNGRIYYLIFGFKDSVYTLNTTPKYLISKNFEATSLSKRKLSIKRGEIQIFA